MNGLSGARVVLLDDEATEALPVIRALSKMGVSVAFFDGRISELPTKKKRLRGIRLAILDMNLGVTGSNETIASTLVQTFSRIIDDDNGPYGVLIWTNHPDLMELAARYIYVHKTLPKPVFVVSLRKAAFKTASVRGGARRFSFGKLSRELLRILAENSPLECLQVWEGACFRAATNVTNSIGELSAMHAADLDEWRQAWREETLKLLFVISKAYAEEHHTQENCIPSIFLALDPLHSDRMDTLVEQVAMELSGHAEKIMVAKGGSATERKAKVNTMLHLASDQLANFSPGNLFLFGKRNRPSFMPPIGDALKDCVEGNSLALQEENLKEIVEHARLCGLEVTPACDYAQNKMGFARVIAGFVLPWDRLKKIKRNAQFLKVIGPFYFSGKLLEAGAYGLLLNSRYVATARPGLVKELRPIARVRPQLLADVQSWASYQSARQGVMLLK
jgi:hypothetical protein